MCRFCVGFGGLGKICVVGSWLFLGSVEGLWLSLIINVSLSPSKIATTVAVFEELKIFFFCFECYHVIMNGSGLEKNPPALIPLVGP